MVVGEVAVTEILEQVEEVHKGSVFCTGLFSGHSATVCVSLRKLYSQGDNSLGSASTVTLGIQLSSGTFNKWSGSYGFVVFQQSGLLYLQEAAVPVNCLIVGGGANGTIYGIGGSACGITSATISPNGGSPYGS